MASETDTALACASSIRSISTLEGPTTIRLPDGRYLAVDGTSEPHISAHVRRAELAHGEESAVIP